MKQTIVNRLKARKVLIDFYSETRLPLIFSIEDLKSGGELWKKRLIELVKRINQTNSAGLKLSPFELGVLKSGAINFAMDEIKQRRGVDSEKVIKFLEQEKAKVKSLLASSEGLLKFMKDHSDDLMSSIPKRLANALEKLMSQDANGKIWGSRIFDQKYLLSVLREGRYNFLSIIDVSHINRFTPEVGAAHIELNPYYIEGESDSISKKRLSLKKKFVGGVLLNLFLAGATIYEYFEYMGPGQISVGLENLSQASDYQAILSNHEPECRDTLEKQFLGDIYLLYNALSNTLLVDYQSELDEDLSEFTGFTVSKDLSVCQFLLGKEHRICQGGLTL